MILWEGLLIVGAIVCGVVFIPSLAWAILSQGDCPPDLVVVICGSGFGTVLCITLLLLGSRL